MNQTRLDTSQREYKIVIAGLGGQGVIFTTRYLAQTAVVLGWPVMISEVHGMSQRGGSVISHLRIGDSKAPLIRRGTADLMLALEADEAIRNLAFLRPGGAIFVNVYDGLPPGVVQYAQRHDIELLALPASRMAMELGSPAVTNVLMVGFAAAHPALAFPFIALQKTLSAMVHRLPELNLQALEAGYHIGAVPV